MELGRLPQPMTQLQALRVLERQLTKAREAVGMLDIKRAINDPQFNQAIDALWEHAIRGAK